MDSLGVSNAAASDPQEGCSVHKRLKSIDVVRGLAMVFMALDHVRDFFSQVRIDPLDLSVTTPALFFTRWITHPCAPAFFFLAGTSAFLWAQRGKSQWQLAWFLSSRGLWLIILEFTVVKFAWTFTGIGLSFKVLWALGASMMALSVLILLPRRVLIVFSIALIAGHNLLDGWNSIIPDSWSNMTDWQKVFTLFHLHRSPILYPLIPWVAVMSAGYAMGPLFARPPEFWKPWLLRYGFATLLAFLVLRYLNFYGNPTPWKAGPDVMTTLMSFLNLEKYPPSLLFLLMMMGMIFVMLSLADRLPSPAARFLSVFGEVPLFFYVAHLYLIHLLAGVAGALTGHDFTQFLKPCGAFPEGYGFNLAMVYAAWILVLLLLYPVCRWFSDLKRRHKSWWLSYL